MNARNIRNGLVLLVIVGMLLIGRAAMNAGSSAAASHVDTVEAADRYLR